MTRFILDHIAKPDIKHGTLDPWREHMRELATLPNVVCKISGMVTEADHKSWTPDDLRPYVDHVIACFGEDRITFGGDWPVAYQAAEYPRWVRTLDELTARALGIPGSGALLVRPDGQPAALRSGDEDAAGALNDATRRVTRGPGHVTMPLVTKLAQA
jgi:hypothetical protein